MGVVILFIKVTDVLCYYWVIWSTVWVDFLERNVFDFYISFIYLESLKRRVIDSTTCAIGLSVSSVQTWLFFWSLFILEEKVLHICCLHLYILRIQRMVALLPFFPLFYNVLVWSFLFYHEDICWKTNYIFKYFRDSWILCLWVLYLFEILLIWHGYVFLLLTCLRFC